MALQKTLLEPPREKGGSKASNRLDYQKNWALCKLLELHSQKEDYVMILDLHDDILILNSSENPSHALFYQIKTNNKGFWNVSDLIKQDTKKKSLISSKLGKLYYNKIKFKEDTKELNFVSNCYYKIKLDNPAKKAIDQRDICIAEVDKEDKNKIINSLSKELNLPKNDILDNIIFLKVCDLNITSHSETTKGKLSDFLEKEMPKSSFKIGIIYRTIFDEIRRKSNEELDCNSFKDLLKYKSISRKAFTDILKNISESLSTDKWTEVLSLLNAEDFTLSEKKLIKNYWDKYKIERMDPANLSLLSLRKKVLIIKKDLLTQKIINCKDLFSRFFDKYKELKTEEEDNLFNQDYLKAIILTEYYNDE